MRVRAQIVWRKKPKVCSVPKTTKDKMKLSSVETGYPALYTDITKPNPLALDPSDIAHVYPCGQIMHNVAVAVANWDLCRKTNLERFARWLFEIDNEAVIQEVFLTGDPANVVSFQSMYTV